MSMFGFVGSDVIYGSEMRALEIERKLSKFANKNRGSQTGDELSTGEEFDLALLKKMRSETSKKKRKNRK